MTRERRAHKFFVRRKAGGKRKKKTGGKQKREGVRTGKDLRMEVPQKPMIKFKIRLSIRTQW
jgi:hypothetical protein